MGIKDGMAWDGTRIIGNGVSLLHVLAWYVCMYVCMPFWDGRTGRCHTRPGGPGNGDDMDGAETSVRSR